MEPLVLVSQRQQLSTMQPLAHTPWPRQDGEAKLECSWLCSLLASCAPSHWLNMGNRKVLHSEVSITQQQLKYQCVVNIILRLNPNHNTVPDTRKKVNFILVKTRTSLKQKILSVNLEQITSSKMKEKWELGLYPANYPKGLQHKTELEKLCFYYRVIALSGSLFLIFQN